MALNTLKCYHSDATALKRVNVWITLNSICGDWVIRDIPAVGRLWYAVPYRELVLRLLLNWVGVPRRVVSELICAGLSDEVYRAERARTLSARRHFLVQFVASSCVHSIRPLASVRSCCQCQTSITMHGSRFPCSVCDGRMTYSCQVPATTACVYRCQEP